MPAVAALHDAIAKKAGEWDDIVKIGRTHMQDATPITLGQEWSGYAGMLADDLVRIEDCAEIVYHLALGGTAVGTGINAAPGFAEAAAAEIATLTRLPFVSAPNKFTVQGSHDALVQLSGSFRTLAVSLYKIANDIRLMACGPRAGFAELILPENEPGSSIMPGKVNPTQAEALTMIAAQVMANDVAVGFGGAGGYLEMNVYKPLMIHNIAQSITILADGCDNFRKFLIEDTRPNLKKINDDLNRSLMLVTALTPVIGYDKASQDRPSRDGARSDAEAGRARAEIRRRGDVRSRRRPEENGETLRRQIIRRRNKKTNWRQAMTDEFDRDRRRFLGNAAMTSCRRPIRFQRTRKRGDKSKARANQSGRAHLISGVEADRRRRAQCRLCRDGSGERARSPAPARLALRHLQLRRCRARCLRPRAIA